MYGFANKPANQLGYLLNTHKFRESSNKKTHVGAVKITF